VKNEQLLEYPDVILDSSPFESSLAVTSTTLERIRSLGFAPVKRSLHALTPQTVAD